MGCQPQIRPGIIPTYKDTTQNKNLQQNIIGEIEPIYFQPMKSPFSARIDTGATTSSIDASNIREFERDGEKWVSFYLINRQTGEKQLFEKQIQKTAKIKRVDVSESRIFVEMTVRFGKETFNSKFSLSNRDKFKFQALIGRNLLSGRAIVDTTIANTLH